MYGPDGEFVLALGDNPNRPGRSHREQLTFRADGRHTVVIGPYERVGIEGYTISIEGEEPAPEPTAIPEPVVVPDFLLSAEGAIDKGALTLNVDTVDEITEEGERHSYSFEASAGQEVTVKLVTGGAGLSGTGFYSPFGTMYGPDGEFVLALGDNPNRPGRSHREQLTFRADGTHTVVIGPYERVGIEGYTISIEGEEPAPEPTAIPEPVVVPDFLLSAEGAIDKGALTLNVDTVDEITEEGERHSYSFEASAGQAVTVKLVTGGAGLSGTGFYSPFGTMYGPDGEFVLALGDNPNRPGRSHREQLIFRADGTHTVVIGPYERVGIEGYTIVIEGEEG